MAAWEDDHGAMDVVSMETFDEILEHIASASRSFQRKSELIISFRCSPDVAWDLSTRLNDALIARDERTIRRFEYDYNASLAHIEMGESALHFEFGRGADQYLEIRLRRFGLTVEDVALRQRIRAILNKGTADVAKKGTILKQADFSFGPGNTLPTLVGEVS